SRRRHTRFSRDWSSDVCSSDLQAGADIRTTKDATAVLPRSCGLASGPLTVPACTWYRGFRARNGCSTYRNERVATPQEAADRTRSEERRVGKEGSTRGGPERRQ